jgi:hypothetical protein
MFLNLLNDALNKAKSELERSAADAWHNLQTSAGQPANTALFDEPGMVSFTQRQGRSNDGDGVLAFALLVVGCIGNVLPKRRVLGMLRGGGLLRHAGHACNQS